MQMARIAETGLVLIPCREGVSHNPAEWTELAEIVQGAEVILEAVRRFEGRRLPESGAERNET